MTQASGIPIDVTLDANTEYFFKNTSEDSEYFSCITDSNGFFAAKGQVINLNTTVVEETDDVVPEQSDSKIPPSLPYYYLLSVAGTQAHIRSNPTGIDCQYGKGVCKKLFDRGMTVELELVSIKTTNGRSQQDYDIKWEGSPNCAKQTLRMSNSQQCLVRVYGKQGINYTSQSEQESLRFLNFSGYGSLNGANKDVILGFILEGDGLANVKFQTGSLAKGVQPQLDLNQITIDENSIDSQLLVRQQQPSDFSFEQSLEAGIYTLQMGSTGAKGHGMASIILENEMLNLTNLSARAHLQNELILNFIIDGEHTQKIEINKHILQGQVTTELQLLNLSTQQLEALSEGNIAEVSEGSYAIIFKAVEGEGIGMIEVNLL